MLTAGSILAALSNGPGKMLPVVGTTFFNHRLAAARFP